MAVIYPSSPNAGTKKGGKREGPRVIRLMAGGLSLSTYDLADRRRHHAAEADRRIFLLPPREALTRPDHDATEMQADPCRC
jgi:hypothetical protein